MSEINTFTDSEVILIKNKMDWKYEKAMILTLIFSIPLLFISPYIPSKRTGERLIDSLGYWNAVALFGTIWLSCIICVYFFNKVKAKKEYNKTRFAFKKKELSYEITGLRNNFLNGNRILKLRFGKEDYKFDVDADLTLDLKVGEKVNVQFEEMTQTVLNIKKV